MDKTNLIPIYVMGKKYEVPNTLTIMKALEYAGYQLVRGCGCRGGVCGACGTVYRFPNSFKIEMGLACQTVVEPNMYLAQLPFFPAKRSAFDKDDIQAVAATFQALYPETFKCVSCNTCTKSCPMDIEVMDYINAVIRGDIETAAKLSFDCVMCGLCTARCPAEISHYNVAILARRMFGKLLTKKADHLVQQTNQVRDGKFKESLTKLKKMKTDELKKFYVEREVEPQMGEDAWTPKSKVGL